MARITFKNVSPVKSKVDIEVNRGGGRIARIAERSAGGQLYWYTLDVLAELKRNTASEPDAARDLDGIKKEIREHFKK